MARFICYFFTELNAIAKIYQNINTLFPFTKINEKLIN